MLYPLKLLTKSITSDNGQAFAYHHFVSQALDTWLLLCASICILGHRGLNEYTNGLIRQYLPKKTDFTRIAKEEITILTG